MAFWSIFFIFLAIFSNGKCVQNEAFLELWHNFRMNVVSELNEALRETIQEEINQPLTRNVRSSPNAALQQNYLHTDDLGEINSVEKLAEIELNVSLNHFSSIKLENEKYLIFTSHTEYQDSFISARFYDNPILLWSPQEKLLTVHSHLKNPAAIQIEPFKIKEKIFVVYAINNYWLTDYHLQASAIHQIYEDGSSVILQHIPTVGASSWKHFELSGYHFLAQSSYQSIKKREKNRFGLPGHDRTISGEAKLTFYIYIHGHFHETNSIQSNYIMDVEIFEIEGQMYLAMSNQMDLDKNYETNIMIYSLFLEDTNSQLPKIRSTVFQKLKTYAPRDIAIIRVGNEVFLAVVNNFFRSNDVRASNKYVPSIIYKWNGFFFAYFQAINHKGALEWQTFEGQRNELVIMLSSNISRTICFQYFDAKWREEKVLAELNSNYIIPLSPYIITHDGDNSLITYKINFNESNYLISEQRELLKSCKKLKDKALNLKEDFSHEALSINLQNETFLKHRNRYDKVIVNGSLNLLHGTSQVNNILSDNFKNISDDVVKLKNGIKDLKIKVNDENIFKKSGKQVIYKDLNCHRINVHNFEAHNIDVVVLNTKEFKKFVNSVILSSPFESDKRQLIQFKNRLFFQELYFNSGLIVNPNRINGVLIENLAKNDEDIIFSAPIYFYKNVEMLNEFNLNGLINGIEMKLLIPKKLSSTKNIHKICHFKNLHIKGDLVQPYKFKINGVSWKNLTENVLKYDSLNKFLSHVHFKNLLVKNSTSVPEYFKINNENVLTLTNNIVLKSGNYSLLNPITIIRPQFKELFLMKNSVNGINLLNDAIKLHDSTWPIHAVFEKIKLKNLIVDSINEIEVNSFVKVHGDQIITGIKEFNSIEIHQDTIFYGTVNHINLNSFNIESQESMILSSIGLNDIKVKKLIISDMKIPKLSRLIKYGIKTNENFNSSTSTIFRFLKPVNLKDVSASTGTMDHLVSTFKHINDLISSIFNSKKFLGDIIFKSKLNVHGLLNSVNFRELNDRALFLDSNQIVKSGKFFYSSIEFLDGFKIDERINNIFMSELFNLKNSIYQNDTSLYIKGTCTLEEANIFGLNVGKNLNGYEVFEIFSNTLKTNDDKKQIISGSKYFKSMNIQNMSSSAIGSIDFEHYFSRVVYVDQPIRLQNIKRFHSKQQFKDFSALQTIDGVNILILYKRGTTDHFKNLLYVKPGYNSKVSEIVSGSLINGVNLENICRKVVKRYNSRLPSNLTISKLILHGSMWLNSGMNDLNIPESIVLKNEFQRVYIYGTKTFHQNIYVKGNLSVALLNGFNIKRLSEELVLNGKDEDIAGSVEFFAENLIFLKDVSFGTLSHHSYSNIEMDKWFANILRWDKKANIFADFSFEKLNFKDEVAVKLFNDVNLKTFSNRILKSGGYQICTAAYIFKSKIQFDTVELEDISILVNKSVNGYDFDKLKSKLFTSGLLRDCRLKSKVITAHWTFIFPVFIDGNLSVSGHINEVSPNDFFWLERSSQTLSGKKYFKHLTIHSLQVAGLIGKVNLSNWHENRVQTSKSAIQSIYGNMYFKSDLMVSSNLKFKEKIQKEELDSFLRKNFNGAVPGFKHFRLIKMIDKASGINVYGNLKGISMKISRIFDILLSFPFADKSVINNTRAIRGNISFQDINMKSDIMRPIKETYSRSKNSIFDYQNQINHSFDTFCNATRNIEVALENAYQRPIKFNTVKTIRFRSFEQTETCTLSNGLPLILSWEYRYLTVTVLNSTTTTVTQNSYFYDEILGRITSVICFSENERHYFGIVVYTPRERCGQNIQILEFNEESGISTFQVISVDGCVTSMSTLKQNQSTILIALMYDKNPPYNFVLTLIAFDKNYHQMIKISDKPIKSQIISMKTVEEHKTLFLLTVDTQFSHHVILLALKGTQLEVMNNRKIIVGSNSVERLFGIESVGEDGDIAFVVPRQTYAGSNFDSVWIECISKDKVIHVQTISLKNLKGIWFLAYGKENVLVLQNDDEVNFYKYEASGQFKVFRTIKLTSFDDISSFGSERYGYYIVLWNTNFVHKTAALYRAFNDDKINSKVKDCHMVCT